VVLLMAGFMAALAIERWNLHRRLALTILVALGTSPRRLIFGMMVATAICSMWISNTASTLIMLPIGLAIVTKLESESSDDPANAAAVANFGTVLFLAIAYAASVGGLGTPVGTPPNMIFMAQYAKTFGTEPSFLDWMGYGLPCVIIGIPLLYLYLTRLGGKLPAQLPGGSRAMIRDELKALGPMTKDEKAVAIVFGMMVLLWVTRAIKVDDEVYGWASALGIASYVHDSTVAVAGAIVLFAFPSRTLPGERLLDWATAKRIPWDVVLLFGGGIALAVAFKDSGLSKTVSGALTGLAAVPVPVMILTIALVVTFLTEVTSNTATTNILMPILAAFAFTDGLDPVHVMLPAVLSASCAFMLPVATAPNAIVYGTGRIPISAMAKRGFLINLGGAVIITLLVWLVF
jgi:sodium-dependent dicarboxylate transporter 2/3/5